MTPSAIAIPARILLSRRPRVSRAPVGRGGASRVVSVRAAAGNRLRGKKEYVPTDRVASLQNEGAYAVLAAANALEAKGKDIVHLEIGQPGFPSPAHVVDAGVEAITGGKTKYSNPSGIPNLKCAIAEYVTRTRGVATSPAQVVVGPGAKPGLFFPTLALVQPGDEVMYPDPGFPTYRAMIEVAGATPVPVPLRPDGASFDMAAFRSKVSDRTKLIVLNSPANPTGGVMPREDVEEVAAIATSADAWVLSDEIYSRLTYDQSEGATSAYSLPDMKERTVLVDGFSKTYCMTGWRLGWAVMPEALAARTELLAVHSYGCVATFTQEAGVAALEGPQDQVDEMVAEYKKRRDFVVSALNAIDGVECPIPAGAFYAFPDVSSFGMTSKQIANLLLNEGGVAVLPGTDFGANGEGKIRLSYVGDMDTLKEGCARIAKVLGKLSSEKKDDDSSKEKKSNDNSSYIITPDSSKGNVGNAMPVIGGGGGGLGANMTWEELDEKVNTYPMDRKFQAIGEGGQSFIDEVVALIEKALGRSVPSGNVTTRPSKKGKYVAVNVTVRLENGNEVLEVYGALKSCERVKWFL